MATTPKSTASSAGDRRGVRGRRGRDRASVVAIYLASTSSLTCREVHRPVSADAAELDPALHASEAVAVAAERRWAIRRRAIIALARSSMMVVTGLHWASMPPSRVGDGRRQARCISRASSSRATSARRWPPTARSRSRLDCPAVLVPARSASSCRPGCRSPSPRHAPTPSMDSSSARTNANTMLVPGLRRDVHARRSEKTGEMPDAVPRVLRHRPRSDVGAGPGAAATEFTARARAAERLSCVLRLASSCSRTSGSPSSPSRRDRAGRVADVRAQPARRLGQQPGALLPLGHRARHRHGLRPADARRDGLRLRHHRARA